MELHQDYSGQRETVQVCSHSREYPKPLYQRKYSGKEKKKKDVATQREIRLAASMVAVSFVSY